MNKRSVCVCVGGGGEGGSEQILSFKKSPSFDSDYLFFLYVQPLW